MKNVKGLIRNLSPDLVITDLEMPGLDGLDLARYLRTRWSGTKVVLVSSHTWAAYDKLASEDGVLAFIPKGSLSLDTLNQALGMEDS